MVKGKKIIIGITGSIAAYKIPSLVRSFIKEGAEVKVVATENALEFVTKVTLETLSKNKLYFNTFDENNDYSTEHISLAEWGDILLVAPASANIIGKFANGIADDALSTLLLAFNKTLFIAPAMNTVMYSSYSVQKNIKYLEEHGVIFIEPTEGEMACGTTGKGRMKEPDKIVEIIFGLVHKKQDLTGIKVMVTAGPTQENIDPVRFISNHSSGLMGFEIANECAERGAEVTLIAGPVNLVADPKIHRMDVVSATDMHQACLKHFEKSDITIMAAAVADFMVAKAAPRKIKKKTDLLSIKLTKTPDILYELGRLKKSGQMLIGFALETDDEINNAKLKLRNKRLNFIVLNSLKDKNAGFNSPTNKITMINRKLEVKTFGLKSKKEVAVDIINEIVDSLKNKL